MSISLNNTFYVDCNRKLSNSSSQLTSEWEYQLNNGIKLPPGTVIQVTNSFLNYQGITGGSIEFLNDQEEELCYGFYVTQGSQFILLDRRVTDTNAGILGSSKDNNTSGAMLYDCLQHRNVENTKSPLLIVTASELPEYPSYPIPNDISVVRANLQAIISRFNYEFQQGTTPPVINTHHQKQFQFYQDNAFTIEQQGFNYKNGNLDNVLAELTIIDGGGGFQNGWLPWIAVGGIPNPPTDIPAKGMYYAVDGVLQKIYISDVGKGYTSNPTIEFYDSGGSSYIPSTLPDITINRGILVTTRTNGSGRFMICTMYNAGMGNLNAGRIMQSGFGYKYDDEVYLDDGIAEGYDANIYPLNHSAPIQETIIKLKHSSSHSDIPSPGIIKAFYENSDEFENIYYNTVLSAPIPEAPNAALTYEPLLFFTMNENENLDSLEYSRGDFYGMTLTGANTNPDINPINASYEIEMKKYTAEKQTSGDASTRGVGYNYLPEITYTPSAYIENNLNEDGYWNPKFRAIMNSTNEVEKVVYIPGGYNDLSSGNIFTEAAVRNTNRTQNKSGVPPGYLGVVGGNPTARAFCRFTGTEHTTIPSTDVADFYAGPQPLIRMFNQSGGLKTGNLSLVFLDITNSIDVQVDGTEYDLIPLNTNFSGTGGKVQISSVGQGNTTFKPLALNVTQIGSGYKYGDIYTIDTVNAVVMVIDLTLPANHPSTSAETDPQFFTVNELGGGIMESNNNIQTKNSYLKGNTDRLPGDVVTADSGTGQGSAEVKYQYDATKTLGFPKLRATGGTEDPIGLCEFDENGILKPVVKTKKIIIPKGIYGLQDIEDLITDAFTDDTEETGFINNSSFTQKIPFHDYEPAQFTGDLNYRTGRYVFIGMEDYNNLINLWAINDQVSLALSFKWEVFRLNNYYAFPKSYFPKPKKPYQVCASLKYRDTGNIWRDTSTIKFDTQSTYSQTNTNLIIGTSDFNFQYDTKKATFAINFLHQPIRNPVYDKFSNKFAQPGQVGAFIRKLANASNIYGIGKQYVHLGGRNSDTPEYILKQLEKPITRSGGVMIHNFSLNRALTGSKASLYTNPQYAKFSDFFNSTLEASKVWENSVWRRTGFNYLQLNERFEDVSYYKNTSVKLYGITTKSNLDTSQIPTISSQYDALVNTGSSSDNQQIFNTTNPSNTSVPVFLTSTYSSPTTGTLAKPEKGLQTNSILDLYQGGLYDACQCFFVQVDGKELLGEELPQLQINGYFIVTSDIIDGYRDSIKRNETIPLLAIVPKISYQSQDFINSYSEIQHVLSNPKVVNKIKIKVYNPDLTNPILGEDSSIMLKITLPPQLPPQISSPGEKKKPRRERRTVRRKAEGKE